LSFILGVLRGLGSRGGWSQPGGSGKAIIQPPRSKQNDPFPDGPEPIIGGVSRETFAVTILAASARLRKRY
jgi:hypothetical protein